MTRKSKPLPPPIRFAIRKIGTDLCKVSSPAGWSETSLGGAKLFTKLESAQQDCEYLNEMNACDYVMRTGTGRVLNDEDRFAEAVGKCTPVYEVVTVDLAVAIPRKCRRA